eukprot:6178077-Pleurochrysis_carterae.AAC.2
MARLTLALAIAHATACAAYVPAFSVGQQAVSTRSASPVATAQADVGSIKSYEAAAEQNILERNREGRPWVEQRSRPRRNRKSTAMRKMVRETVRYASCCMREQVGRTAIADHTCLLDLLRRS